MFLPSISLVITTLVTTMTFVAANNHKSGGDVDLPEGSWDSHVHVIDEATFPFDPNHAYRPAAASLDQLNSFHATLSPNLNRSVLVQPSVYGFDNSAMFDSLVKLRGEGRGVAVIDTNATSDGELQFMHNIGVRALRVNLRSTGQRPNASAISATLQKTAAKIKKYGWSIQMYIYLDQMQLIAPVIPDLGVPVIFDHLGSPNETLNALTQPGASELLSSLAAGNTWVKISGIYRFSDTPALGDFVKQILATAPDRAVYASDWPHTGGVENNPGGNRTIVQPYRQVDDVAFINQVKEWCSQDKSLIRKVFVDNPSCLWQYDGKR